MSKLYESPHCLTGRVAPDVYSRWLQRKAAVHVRHDKKRGNSGATIAAYKKAIHMAVIASAGNDHYTGELLDWSLLSQYDNEQSKARGRVYKKQLAALSTLDHIGDGLGEPDFVISAWRTNDAKHDLTLQEFLALCQCVLQHHGYRVSKA